MLNLQQLPQAPPGKPRGKLLLSTLPAVPKLYSFTIWSATSVCEAQNNLQPIKIPLVESYIWI